MASYTGFMALILLSSTAFGATSDECITQAEQRISRLELLMNEREAYTGKKQSAERKCQIFCVRAGNGLPSGRP